MVIRRTSSLRRAASITTLAAADTVRSKESSSWADRRTSTSTVVRCCHGWSNCRTTGEPRRAELRQWIRRMSSPGWYGRSAANSSSTVELEVRARMPRSGSSPGAGGSGLRVQVRGSTITVRTPGCTVLDRTNPNGSSMSTPSGPTVCMPRRCVGNTYAASRVAPEASGASCSDASPKGPTSSRRARTGDRTRATLRTRSTTWHGSSTARRPGRMERLTSSRSGAARTTRAAIPTAATAAIPTAESSGWPNNQPSSASTGASTSTTTPLRVGRTARRFSGGPVWSGAGRPPRRRPRCRGAGHRGPGPCGGPARARPAA